MRQISVPSMICAQWKARNTTIAGGGAGIGIGVIEVTPGPGETVLPEIPSRNCENEEQVRRPSDRDNNDRSGLQKRQPCPE
jgi:hypothetical protein